MNRRAVVLHCIVFTVQWGLMLLGFGLISKVLVPFDFPQSSIFVKYMSAGLKALLGLFLSVVWLFIWDRQVRIYFYKGIRFSE